MHKRRQNSTARMLYPTDLSAPGALDALLAAHRATFGGFRMVEDTPFAIPEDVTQVEDLEAAVQGAMAESERISSQEDLTDEELNRLEALADFVDAARAEATAREQAAEERTARAEAARARIAGQSDDEEGGEGDAEEDDAEEDDAQDGDEDGGQEGSEGDSAEQTEAVAAGGAVRRRRAPGLVRRIQRQDNPTPAGSSSSSVVITAAAGIRDVEPGSRLPDLDALTKAFMQKLSGFPANRIPGQYIKSSVATLSTGGWGDLDQAAKKYDSDMDLILAAGNERRLKGADGRTGLVAAGGWCAPSETLYDFLSPFTTEGMIGMPEFRVTRGGVNTTIGPDWEALFADANVDFVQTEAQAEAGDVKPCIEVDCPPFSETRLDATGYCVKSPILTQVGYPELVRDFLAGVAVGHQLKLSARTISSLQALIGAAVTVPNAGSAARSVLTALELAAEGERQRFNLALDETLEVKLPAWLEVVIRDDLASRMGVDPKDDVITDAVIAAQFAARGLDVEYVRGLQPLAIPASGVVTDFPDTVEALMYPAGTFVRGRQDVISLDAVYDSTNLTTNMYTAAFFEEAMLVLRRGRGGVRLTIPLDSTGSQGPLNLPRYGVVG